MSSNESKESPQQQNESEKEELAPVCKHRNGGPSYSLSTSGGVVSISFKVPEKVSKKGIKMEWTAGSIECRLKDEPEPILEGKFWVPVKECFLTFEDTRDGCIATIEVDPS